jgi:hypothetical protein
VAVRTHLLLGSWLLVGAVIAGVNLIGTLLSVDHQRDLSSRTYVTFGTRRIGWLLACFYVLDTLLWPVAVYWSATRGRTDDQ